MSHETTPDPLAGMPAGLQALLDDLARRMPKAADPATLPLQPLAELREVQSGEDLVARFVKEAEAAGCNVQRVAEADWPGAVVGVLQGHGARRVYCRAQAGTALDEARTARLTAALAEAGIEVTAETDDETLFTVDAGVTGVTAAIAETGTLACRSGSDAPRGATLIPPVHVALFDAKQIVGDLFDYFELLAGTELPANVNLITGPSKTADIEGILVTGVHGPGHVHLMVLESK